MVDGRACADACSAGSIEIKEEECPKQGCLRGGSPSAMTSRGINAGVDAGAAGTVGGGEEKERGINQVDV